MSDDQKTELQVERERFEVEAAAVNDKLTGKGLRTLVGATRGRSTMNIKYQAFDDSKPDTLPTTVEEFVSLTGIKSNSDLCELLVVGFNDKAYTEASDPIAEHVNKAWGDELKMQFRLVVRNYSKAMEISIDDAVKFIKPGVEKKFLASVAK